MNLLDLHIAAFWLGLFERLKGYDGRTHEFDSNWNESYDRGMNVAEAIKVILKRGA